MSNRALLVGVNSYAKQTALRGCINDCTDVGAALTAGANVRSEDIVELLDARATKHDILGALRKMIAGLAPGDSGYFHFSGHGVQMPTDDPEEPDGLDEVLCPHEFDWTPETGITDNEVLDVLAALPLDRRMVVTIDSCHSGDQARALIPKGRPRTLPPPPNLRRRGAVPLGLRGIAKTAPSVAFLSAVSPWQLAIDTSFGGRDNGAFTNEFLRRLREVPGTTLTDAALAIEPALRGYNMTPVAENGDVRYLSPGGRRSRKRTRAVRASSARAATVVFDRAFHARLLGQELSVSVRVANDGGELIAHVAATYLGQSFASPPIPTTGNLTFPLDLGMFGLRLVVGVTGWQRVAAAIAFTLELSIVSDLAFVPHVDIGRTAVHVDLASMTRGLAAAYATSPADVVALLALHGATPPPNDRAATAGASRDPAIQVFATGVAKWGPNWREDRIIRPFADRPRPDGIRRYEVRLGPQRGQGNTYVVGWLSDQETDFDFVLHMGNNFFGGWGERDWLVEGYYADIQPFPRSRGATPRASEAAIAAARGRTPHAPADPPKSADGEVSHHNGAS
ncbi:MAG: caspase family protein [Deltaproteobacteria bacterium]|nr:caspase family protein [Deltaproteobacteria bacterium]